MNNKADSLDEARPVVQRELVNRTQLATMMGCSRKKTYQLEKLDADFPKPQRDACGTQQWRRREVLEYIDAMWSEGDGAA